MKYFFSILMIAVSAFCFSQDVSKLPSKYIKQFEIARHKYINKDYTQALEEIDKLIRKDDGILEAFLLKADILHEMSRTEMEVSCLERILEIDLLKYPKAFFLLGRGQQKLGEFEKAKRSFLSFIEYAGNLRAMIEQARKNIIVCDFAVRQMANPVIFEPKDLGDSINSVSDEYWPSLSLDGKTLVFTRLVSTVDTLGGHRLPQEDFYTSDLKNRYWTEARPIDLINTSSNEGAQAISPDADYLFFTACSRRDTWGGCDLYFSKKTRNEWEKPVNVGQPVNSSAWESQPSVSPNNQYLYFASNRKGGKGGMDIWRCRIINIEGDKIRWGKVENLGDSINTPGDEMSPFIHPDGQTLYFTSDYWPGMGGNDIFFAKMKADSSWSKPMNIGYPINTIHDERGLVVDASGKTAYYSSDKTGKGMDIYSFIMPEKIRPVPVTYVKGTITDAKNNDALIAEIELGEIDHPEKVINLRADENGQFLTGLAVGKNYMMNISAPGYLFYSEHFGLDKVKSAIDPFLLEIRLNPIEPGAVTILRNIFFETASFELLPESITELNKLMEFLKLNPSVKIEIGGHTDNIGTEQYNLDLSTNRAESVFNFLVEQGIDKDRLRFKGYGYMQPVEENDTEKGRAANRRTEFKIIE